jgi:hypothetical protein
MILGQQYKNWLFKSKVLSARNAKKLFLGDSVFNRVSDWDRDKRSMSQMLEYEEHSKCISYSALNTLHFEILLNFLLKNNGTNISKIIFPINMRSFSPQWYLNKEFSRHKLLSFIERSGFDFSHHRIDYTQKIKPLRITINNEPEFIEYLNYQSYVKSRKSDLREQILLKYHYLGDISQQHPILNSLRRIKRDFCDFEISFFFTPINFSYIHEVLGGTAIEKIYETQCAIKEEFENDCFNFITLPTFKQGDFFSPEEKTEHLNFRGRSKLVDLISI